MKEYIALTILALFIGCADTKQKKGAIASIAFTKGQVMSEIDIKRERMKSVEIGQECPLGSFLGQDSITKTTNDLKGKLLVIDFWATWCAPCLKEVPKFKELEKKYESEKVEFITVSIDDQFTHWKEFITKNKWSTDNYWLGMNESSPVFPFMYSEIEHSNEKSVVTGLPKYVIISPNGKIINNKAPKPSDAEFEKELVQLIEEYST